MAKLLALTALLAVVGAQAGIYPDDHWSYSTKLSVDDFDAHVKSEVDAGRLVTIQLPFMRPALSGGVRRGVLVVLLFIIG